MNARQIKFRGETLQRVKTDPAFRRSPLLAKHRRSKYDPHAGAKQAQRSAPLAPIPADE